MPILQRPRCFSILLQKHPVSLSRLKQIHAQLLTHGLDSAPVLAQLIHRYSALPSPQATKHAHLTLTHYPNPNVYLLNVLIKCSHPRDSILLFADWVSRSTLKFDEHTFIFAFGACARSHSLSALWEGKQVHCQSFKSGFMSNIMVQTTGIHFYSSNWSILSARQLFDEMPKRNIVTWNAMIKGYWYQKEKDGDNAHKALVLFKALLVDVNGAKPNDTTMLCVLSAASQMGVLETGTCIHGCIEKLVKDPENDVFIGTGLVDMYSKCGRLENAMYVFSKMNEKDIFTWTSMVTGLALHGKGKQALNLLDDMKSSGVSPNDVTLTSLFSACCHSGLVEEGLCLFYSMERKYGVSPLIHHYGCVIDLLGRAGLLKEAYELIMVMKIEPDVILWRSLLNSCKVHGDIEMGEKVGKALLEFRPKQSIEVSSDKSQDYIALSNVYASMDRWEDVGMLREMMKMKGIQTKPGCSLVQSSY